MTEKKRKTDVSTENRHVDRKEKGEANLLGRKEIDALTAKTEHRRYDKIMEKRQAL